MLEGTHSNYVSSGLESLLVVTIWSFRDFSSDNRQPLTSEYLTILEATKITQFPLYCRSYFQLACSQTSEICF